MKKSLVALFTVILALSPAIARAAETPLAAEATTSEASTITIDVPATGPSDINTIIMGIVNILITIAGIASIIVIIVGGIMMVTSAGNSDRVKAAKDAVLYAVIGLVIALLAFAIVNFVLGRL